MSDLIAAITDAEITKEIEFWFQRGARISERYHRDGDEGVPAPKWRKLLLMMIKSSLTKDRIKLNKK